jgi:hypothetical protein
LPRALLDLNAGIPAALGQERLWVGHLQNLAQGPALVVGMLVVRLDDAISNPVAKVPGLFGRAVVELGGDIGLVFVGDERGLDLLFAPRGRLPQARIRDVA